MVCARWSELELPPYNRRIAVLLVKTLSQYKMPEFLGITVDRELLGIAVNFAILLVLLGLMWMILDVYKGTIN